MGDIFEWPLDKVIDGLCSDIVHKQSSKSPIFMITTTDNQETFWQLKLKVTLSGISIMLCLCSDEKNCLLADFEIDLYSQSRGSRNANQMKWASCKKKQSFSNYNPDILIYTYIDTEALRYLYEKDHVFTICCRMYIKVLKCGIEDRPSPVPAGFEKLLHNKDFSDVILIAAKSGKEFHLHRNILAGGSTVLAEELKHCMRGSREQVEMKIEGFDDDVIEDMINYIYCGKVKNLNKFSTELLRAAEEFKIEGLLEKYLGDFCKNISVENACALLNLLHQKNLKDLKSQVIEFIVYNLQHIDKSAFESIDCPILLKDIFYKTANVYARNK